MNRADEGGSARGRRSAWPLAAGIATVTAAALTVGVTGVAAARTPNLSKCASELGIGGSIRVRAGTTPASALASYAVLRRPQDPSDHPPASAEVPDAASMGLASYDPSLTRLLATTSGGSVYLVVGVTPPSRIALSAACKRLIPPAELRALTLERTLLGSGPAYALVEVPAGGGSSAEVLATASFAFSQSGFAYGVTSTDSGADELTALVPDGVGAVRVAYVPPVGSFALTVQNNLASGVGPAASTSTSLPARKSARRRYVNKHLALTITWLTAPDGSIVRVFARPPTLVHKLLEFLSLVAPTGSSPGTITSTSSSSCGPAKRHGRAVYICTTTTRTCVPTKVNGHVKQRCSTSTKVTVSKPAT